MNALRLLSDVRECVREGDTLAARVILARLAEDEAPDQFLPIVHEVEDLIRAGMLEEAARRLDLFLKPKFASVGASREAYAAACNGGNP